MAMGQAVGVMAALSSSTGTDLLKLPMDTIHERLKEHGAIVPDLALKIV